MLEKKSTKHHLCIHDCFCWQLFLNPRTVFGEPLFWEPKAQFWEPLLHACGALPRNHACCFCWELLLPARTAVVGSPCLPVCLQKGLILIPCSSESRENIAVRRASKPSGCLVSLCSFLCRGSLSHQLLLPHGKGYFWGTRKALITAAITSPRA